MRCASCPNPFDISLAVVRIPLPPTTPCLFFEQVDELLKARSGAAQALVQDLASSELDTLRAFTTNGFYTTVVDQMTQCLQDIQAADKAGSVLAPALAPALKTSMLELLGMPNPLVGSQPDFRQIFYSLSSGGAWTLRAGSCRRSARQLHRVLCRQPNSTVGAVMPGMRLHAILRCSAVCRESRLQLTLSYALNTMAAVSLALPWPAGVPQADAGRKGRGPGRPSHRAACQPRSLHRDRGAAGDVVMQYVIFPAASDNL